MPDLNKPLPFFGSPAEQYRAEESRRGYTNRDWPEWQPYVISGSLAIFLIYFCILREENDIDEQLRKGNIYAQVPQMELLHLKEAYLSNKKNNLSNEAVEIRLKEMGVPLSALVKSE